MMRLISYYMGEKIENGKNKHVNELEKINECNNNIQPQVNVGALCRYYYAPNFEKVGDILVSACPYVRIHVRDIVLKLHVWIPHGKIADAYFWFSLNYLPLSNYGPLTNKGMKFCKCRTSKSIIARNLCQLIGDDKWNI